MEEKNLNLCPHCGFEYDLNKNESCPKCNDEDMKRNIIVDLSEVTLHMPFGGKLAILLTSCYSIIRISDMLFHLVIINIILVVLYLAIIYFWLKKLDVIERPIWFLVMVFVLIMPVLTLIAMIILL